MRIGCAANRWASILVSNSTPEPVITELERIIDAGEGGLSQNVVKLQPIWPTERHSCRYPQAGIPQKGVDLDHSFGQVRPSRHRRHACTACATGMLARLRHCSTKFFLALPAMVGLSGEPDRTWWRHGRFAVARGRPLAQRRLPNRHLRRLGRSTIGVRLRTSTHALPTHRWQCRARFGSDGRRRGPARRWRASIANSCRRADHSGHRQQRVADLRQSGKLSHYRANARSSLTDRSCK